MQQEQDLALRCYHCQCDQGVDLRTEVNIDATTTLCSCLLSLLLRADLDARQDVQHARSLGLAAVH